MESSNIVLILVVIFSLVVNIEKKMIIKELNGSLDLRDSKITSLRKRLSEEKENIYRVKHYNKVLENQLRKISKEIESYERKNEYNWL